MSITIIKFVDDVDDMVLDPQNDDTLTSYAVNIDSIGWVHVRSTGPTFEGTVDFPPHRISEVITLQPPDSEPF